MQNFGLTSEQILGLPPQQPSPVASLLAQPQAAPDAFVWGAGGQRLTPDEIARQRQIADAQVAAGMDYSPVGSWTQGLARVAQGLVGGMDERRLDKASAANASADQDIVAKLLAGGGNGNAALSVLADPRAGDGPKTIAKLLFQQQNKNPVEPPPIVRLAAIVNDPTQPQWARDAAKAQMEVQNNPVITLPGGGLGLRSDVVNGLGGGDPSSTGEPPQAAIDYLRGNPTLAPDFDAKYGAGASQRYLNGGSPTSNMGIPADAVSPGGSTPTVLSRADAAPFIKSLGPEGFQRWMAMHNIRLGN